MTKLLEYFKDQACFLFFGVAAAGATSVYYEVRLPVRVQKVYERVDTKFNEEHQALLQAQWRQQANDAALMHPYAKNGNIAPDVMDISHFPRTWENEYIDRKTGKKFTAKFTGNLKWPY